MLWLNDFGNNGWEKSNHRFRKALYCIKKYSETVMYHETIRTWVGFVLLGCPPLIQEQMNVLNHLIRLLVAGWKVNQDTKRFPPGQG